MRPRRIAYLLLFCASLYTLWPRSTRHETTAHARALIPTPRAQESTSARTGCPAHRSLAVMVMPDAYETESDYARVIGAWERAEDEACANRWRVRFHWVWPRDPPHTLPLPRILGEKKRVWFVDELIAYPPKQFVLRMWHQVATQLGGVYDWAVKMDADAYLSVQKLIARLEHFDPAVPGYFGGAGYGRPLIRDGVGVRYCMGMGYVLSLHLARLAFADETVLRQADRFPNSDIAVARRVMDAAQIQCNDNGGEHMSPLFVNNYYGVRQGLLYPRYINAKGQIDTPMFDRPPHHILHAVLVHPIKNMDQRRAFERVLDDGVYPTLPFDVRAVVETARDSAFGEARKYVTHYQTKVKGSCVANYAQQIVEYQHRLKSCEYTCRGKVLWQQALVHSLRPSAVRRRLEPLLAPLFDRVDFIHAVDGRALTLPATTLEPGEWGYRQTMRGILTRLAQSDDTAWVVMDDDVLVHENAKNMLAAALHDTYCGAALCGGGVLMLSASIWYNGTWPNLKGHYVGGWHLIDHDREAHKSLCASGHTGVLGSVAVAYTRPAARYILAWLDDPEKVHKPFDHVFADMASHGHPVRLLGEHVFAARLDTPSSTNAKRVYQDVHEVQRVHRWEMVKYNHIGVYILFFLSCVYATELYPMSSFLLRNTSDKLIFRIVNVFKRSLNDSSISCSVDGVEGSVEKFHIFKQEDWALQRIPTLTHVQGSFDCEIIHKHLPNDPRYIQVRVPTKIFKLNFYVPEKQTILRSGLILDSTLENKISFCIAPVFGKLALLHHWVNYHTKQFQSTITLYIFQKLNQEHYDFLNTLSNVRLVHWRIEDLKTGDNNYNPLLMQMNYSYYAQYSAMADCVLRSSGARAIKFSDMDEFLVKASGNAQFSEKNHDRITLYHICATPCLNNTQVLFSDKCNRASKIRGVQSIINGHIAAHQYPYYEAYRHVTPSPFATTSNFVSFHFRNNNRVQGECTEQVPHFSMFLKEIFIDPIESLHVKYINLKIREDRKRQVQQEFYNYGFKKNQLERVEAQFAKNGAYGCLISHLKALKMAMDQQLDQVLIVEDDFAWSVEKNVTHDVLRENLNDKSWSILLLSCKWGKFSPRNTVSSHPTNCQTTTGYVVRKDYYLKLFNHWNEYVQKQLISPEKYDKRIVNGYQTALDQSWKILQITENIKWSITKPMLAHQRKSYSDIEKKEVSYWEEAQPKIFGTLMGRLGNQLFQWASIQGIAQKNGMSACVSVGDAWKSSSIFNVFSNVESSCVQTQPIKLHVGEGNKYATYRDLHFKNNVVVEGFLQSYKYFPPNVYDYLKFKDGIATVAKRELIEGKTNIGIHVRHEHAKQLNYLRFPPNDYFENVMNHFRREFTNAFFYVASDNTVWCKQQSFFQSRDVKIIEHDPSLDMAVLASCDHMILTIGTFGWWSAFLGAHKNSGKVIYYKEEFVMEHEINKGNVVKDDYYPKEWISNEQLIQKYTPHESTIVTAYFDIPSKHSK